MMLSSSSQSLVKYDTPVVVTTRSHNVDGRSTASNNNNDVSLSSLSRSSPSIYTNGTLTDSSHTGYSPAVKQAWAEGPPTEEVLNSILPPRRWTAADGTLWIQSVSSAPATRQQVLSLQEELDSRLLEKQARETGLCPVRMHVYRQCFDEIIRQVTVNCCERGLLLVRVRDEMRMTLEAYRTLYESSVSFGMRKALTSERGQANKEHLIVELQSEKKELEKRLQEQRLAREQAERRAMETRQLEQERHGEAIQQLRRTNLQLKAQLEGILSKDESMKITEH